MPAILAVGDFADTCVAETIGIGSITIGGIALGAPPMTGHEHVGGIGGIYDCVSVAEESGLVGVEAEGQSVYAIGTFAACGDHSYERNIATPPNVLPLLERVTIGE